MVIVQFVKVNGQDGRKAYSEIISSLIFIYRETDQLEEAEILLSDWVIRNPQDNNAADILEEIRSGG
ncbi:hypothetical protein Ct9H90mP29_14690 [bacterium]|nr:MAG: hypothetical protein Ct9H90mP29_14690 [bacterium]